MENLSKSEQERSARLNATRRRRIKLIFIWLAILGLIGGGTYGLINYFQKAKARQPGVAIPIVGEDHIPLGQAGHGYNSNPPTSGSHYPDPAKWGIYEQALSDEQLIHNLEHGGIWISYRDPGDQGLISKLKDIVDDYPLKVILTPRPANDSKIAVAAWGHLLKLENFDRKAIQDFIKAFINKGPEQVPY